VAVSDSGQQTNCGPKIGSCWVLFYIHEMKWVNSRILLFRENSTMISLPLLVLILRLFY